MSNFEGALLAMIGDSEEIRAKSVNRMAGLVAMGHSPEEAKIMDEAFNSAVRESVALIGCTIDGLADGLQGNALLYVMRGVVANLDSLEDELVSMSMQAAMEQGIPIVVSGGAPGCNSCISARRANEAMGTNGTRH